MNDDRPSRHRPAQSRRRGALDHQGRRREAVPVGTNAPAIRQRPAAPSCSCTARRWRRSRPSTCRCRAGRFLGDGFFRAPRLRLLVVDMEGYGRSDQGPRQQCADRAGRRRLLRGRDLYPEAARQAAVSGLRHLVGRAARRDVRRAPSRTGGAACARRHGVDRRRLADARRAAQEAARIPGQEPPADRQGLRPFDLQPRPSRHAPRTSVIEAFADAIIALDDSVPTGTYVDMCAHLPVVDPERSPCRRSSCAASGTASRGFDDLIEFFEKLPEPGQAIHRDARHLARELPAEELHAGLPHPPELLHAAGARVSGVMTINRHGRA